MAIFILKRIGLGLITLWILSLIVFFAAQILPGDPARAILGPLAAPSAVNALSHQLGTGKPVDRILSVVGLSAVVIPELVSGIILILIFGIWLNVLPIQASTPPGSS